LLYHITIDGKTYRLELSRADGRWQCRLDGREVQLDAVLTGRNVLSVLIGSKAYEIKREITATEMHLWVGSARYAAEMGDPRSLGGRKPGAAGTHGPKKLVAPMPGRVVRVLARERDEVEVGQGVIVVEAMKMQNEIKSPKKGIMQKMLTTEGANVNAGDVLAIVE
jgi:biotin carboxyl carrier protein